MLTMRPNRIVGFYIKILTYNIQLSNKKYKRFRKTVTHFLTYKKRIPERMRFDAFSFLNLIRIHILTRIEPLKHT